MRFSPLFLAGITSVVTVSTGAFPGAAPIHRTVARIATPGPAAMRFGRSIGSPTDGHLVGGMHLDDAPYIRIVPTYANGDVRWGLEPLVTMIDRAARQVRRQFPDAVTSVGHISRAGGGDLERHHSHESGRDADIAFFVRSGSGHQLLASRFVAFEADGKAPSWPGAYFDDAKNWALVSALVTDPEAHVTHIFVAAPLRARLLAYAEKMGTPASIRMRAAELLQQPHGALPHDDHFHVRIGCPSHMSGCVENPAMRARHPASVIARGRRDESGAPFGLSARLRRDLRPVPHGLVTHPPAATPAPAAPKGPVPGEETEPVEPDAPPAVLPSPIDDVDG